MQLQDFDEKVVNKMALLADKFGQQECFTMLDNLAGRMRSKLVRPWERGKCVKRSAGLQLRRTCLLEHNCRSSSTCF